MFSNFDQKYVLFRLRAFGGSLWSIFVHFASFLTSQYKGRNPEKKYTIIFVNQRFDRTNIQIYLEGHKITK